MIKTELKIIQSYWSKPGIRRSGWSHTDFHFLSWILSCLKLKAYYPEVELITDEKGKKLWIDILNLPYDRVSLRLDDLQDCNERVWTWGKLWSYSIQRQPFLHVDGDVLIWKKLPFRDEPLMAQHKESRFEHNRCFFNLLREKGYEFPPEIAWDDANVNEANAGVLGGNDLSFFARYTRIAFKFLRDNRDRISVLSAPNEITAVNTIMEQGFFFRLAEQRNTPVRYLFDAEEVKDDFLKLVNFMSVPHASAYIHPVGYHKKNPVIGEWIARLLYYEYPRYFRLFEHHKKEIYDLCR